MLGQIVRRVRATALVFCLLGAAIATQPLLARDTKSDRTTIGPRADYAPLAEQLSQWIRAEIEDKKLPALSIALVDGQEIVWSAGFGLADPEKNIPATAETIYRVGSVSKLFTDWGIMRLVERGELDLDAPIETYVPDFKPQNPFGKPITLRRLVCHRAGLVREPPVGNYFDPTEPSLAETMKSLNTTALVYEPGTHTKYSNAGIGLVGYVLEKKAGKPFAEVIQQEVLDPLSMNDTAFDLTPEVKKRLAKASMWTYDGRLFPAPGFRFGMDPCGGLYSSVNGLAQFMRVLFAGGHNGDVQVLKPESLEAMWTPQETGNGKPGKREFGIGFAVSKLNGKRRIGHGGAVYGFATEFAALPDEKLGVAVVNTMDVANTVSSRLADHALSCMLALREGKPLPKLPRPGPVEPNRAQQLAGLYTDGKEQARIERRDDQLYLLRGSFVTRLRWLDDALVVDDRHMYKPVIKPQGPDAFELDDRKWTRVEDKQPAPAPDRWKPLIGEYGWDHNTLYILEHEGQLHALIEWFYLYPLKELGENEFAFPDYGLYEGEKVIFSRGADGLANKATAASVVFERRAVGTAEGETFRIKPQRPVEELRSEALAAQPPKEPGELREPDLVELATLDPTIKLDIRYATTNNFMSTVFYSQPRAFMQRPAAEALVRVHKALKERGYGLLIHDAYRPWYVTKMFWDATPSDKRIFVADPSKGSRHNRGCAVDLTLYELASGKPVQMVGGYDEMTPRSYPDYPGGTDQQRWLRNVLRRAMEAEGFRVYEFEWWHFDFRDWQKYPILNKRFEELTQSK